MQVVQEFLESKNPRERCLAAFEVVILTRVIRLPEGPPKRQPLTAPKKRRKSTAVRRKRSESGERSGGEDAEVEERRRRALEEAEARAAAPTDEAVH